jgi:hypothetical protein
LISVGEQRFRVAAENVLKRLLFFPFRMLRRERFNPIEPELELKIDRLLRPQVPSLSKVAMRSSGLTKSGEPSFVIRSTNAIIAFFGAVSFHEDSGSPPPCAKEVVLATASAAATTVAIVDLIFVRMIGINTGGNLENRGFLC